MHTFIPLRAPMRAKAITNITVKAKLTTPTTTRLGVIHSSFTLLPLEKEYLVLLA